MQAIKDRVIAAIVNTEADVAQVEIRWTTGQTTTLKPFPPSDHPRAFPGGGVSERNDLSTGTVEHHRKQPASTSLAPR